MNMDDKFLIAKYFADFDCDKDEFGLPLVYEGRFRIIGLRPHTKYIIKKLYDIEMSKGAEYTSLSDFVDDLVTLWVKEKNKERVR